MLPAPKKVSDWQPSASIDNLKARAALIANIRDFFHARGLWEVETPLMAPHTVTAPYIDSLQCHSQFDNSRAYLQTSPEYAMKRMLAAGSGSIFQICKAFRDEACGKHHRREFTMLEWYRVGWDHFQLMDEMDELLQAVLKRGAADKITYRDIFLETLSLDPFTASLGDIQTRMQQAPSLAEIPGFDYEDRDTCLQLLLNTVEPTLGQTRPLILYHYPASQAALAKVLDEDPPVAARFEVYVDGVELANGFYELQDAKEQRARFEKDLQLRRAENKTEPTVDEPFLQALDAGLPTCAGVAVGIDRLVMCALGVDTLSDVSF